MRAAAARSVNQRRPSAGVNHSSANRQPKTCAPTREVTQKSAARTRDERGRWRFTDKRVCRVYGILPKMMFTLHRGGYPFDPPLPPHLLLHVNEPVGRNQATVPSVIMCLTAPNDSHSECHCFHARTKQSTHVGTIQWMSRKCFTSTAIHEPVPPTTV